MIDCRRQVTEYAGRVAVYEMMMREAIQVHAVDCGPKLVYWRRHLGVDRAMESTGFPRLHPGISGVCSLHDSCSLSFFDVPASKWVMMLL
jgi:hypothetical protein